MKAIFLNFKVVLLLLTISQVFISCEKYVEVTPTSQVSDADVWK